MDETEARKTAERAHSGPSGDFATNYAHRTRSTWVVHWTVTQGDVLYSGITLVSPEGRTRPVREERPIEDLVLAFEEPLTPSDAEDVLPDGWTLERIRDMGIAHPEMITRPVDVLENAGSDLVELDPMAVLDTGGLCLVLDRSDRHWHMGQWDDKNTIVCWGAYGTDLGEAIYSL